MASDYNEEIKESSFPVDFHGEPEPIDMYGVWVKSGPRDPSLPQTDPDPLQETETLPQTGMQPETGEIPAEPDFAAENTEVSAEDSLAALDLPQDWEDTLSSGQETGESVSGTAQEEFREEPEAEPVPVFEEPAEEDNRAGAAEITDEDVSSLFLSGDPVPAEEDFSALISGTEEPENQTLEDFTFEDVDFDEIAVEPPVPGPEAAEAPAGEPAGRNVEFTAIFAEDGEEIGEFPAEDFAPPAGEAASVAADSGTGDGETEETGPSAFPDAFESSVPEPAARPAEDSGGPGLDDFTQTEGSLPDIRFEETDVPAFPESAAAPAGKTAAQQEPESAPVAADSGTGAGETEEIDLSAFLDAFESSVPEPAARPAEDSGDLDLDDFINAVNESGGHTEKEKEKIFDDIEPLDLDLEFDEEFIAETEKKEAAGAVSAHSEYFDSEFGVEFFDETAGDAPRPPENTAGSADSDFDDFDAMFASIQDEAQPEATPAETPAAAGKSVPAEAEIEAQPFVQQETHTEADTENTSEFDDFLQSLEDTPSAPVQQHTGSTAGSASGFVLNVTEEDEDETGSVPVQDQEEDDGENISVSLRSSGTGGEPPAGPSPGISFSAPAAHSTADDDELDRILAEVSFDTADTATPETAPNAENAETGETAESEPEAVAEAGETAESEPEPLAEPEIAADSDFAGILPAESEPEAEAEPLAEPEIAVDSDFAGILPAEAEETAETETEPEIAVDSDFADILPAEAEETAESEPEAEAEPLAEQEAVADSDFADILPAESGETAESEPEAVAEPEIAADSDFAGILPAESAETAESEPETEAEPEIAADSDFAGILPAEAGETAETETEPELEPEAVADSDFADILPVESVETAESAETAETEPEIAADSDFDGILPAEAEETAETDTEPEAVADSDFTGILPAESAETAEEAEPELEPETVAEAETAADSDFAGILPAETGETAESEPEAVAEAEAIQNGKEEKPVDFPAGQEYTDASAEEKDILFDDLSALEHDLRHGGAENTDKIHEEEMNEKSNEILLTIAAELSSIKQELANLKFGMVPAGAALSEQSAEDIPPSSVPDKTANAAAQPAPEEPAEAEAETVKNTGEAQDFPDIEISHITNIDEDDDTAYLSGAGEETDLDNVAIEDEPDLEILDLDKEKLEEPELSDFSVEIGDIGISGTEFTESAEEPADGQFFAEPQTEAETASVAGTETGLPAAENDNGDIPELSLVDETEAGTFEDLDFRPMEDSMEDQPEAEPVMEIPDIQTPEIPEEIFAQQEEEPAAAISGIPDSAGQEDEPEIPEELSAADPAASGDGNAAAEIPETETEGENPPVQPAAEIKPEAAVQNTEGEISGGEAKDAEAKTETLPSDLKEEIKSVLSYMDQLLENLPEEKIEEFARSKHFEVYKKLFEDLGIS